MDYATMATISGGGVTSLLSAWILYKLHGVENAINQLVRYAHVHTKDGQSVPVFIQQERVSEHIPIG